jgi:alpha-methylacyl-CoA racemase
MKGQGPLAGLKIVELAGIGPAPMAAMLLASSRGRSMARSLVIAPGTISAATASASGVATNDATNKCAKASGRRGPRIAA